MPRLTDMATVLLVRHGRTTANAAGILAGRAPGVRLDDVGRAQAERTAERLAAVHLAGLVTSPMERCRQTSRIILSRQAEPPKPSIAQGLTECDYGEWQGRNLAELAREPLWSTVQSRPSTAVFPGGESMLAMQRRAVTAIRRRDAAVEAQHGADAVWVAVSHADVIKSIIADALGMDFDRFQRIFVAPASVSVIRYSSGGAELLATNTESGDLAALRS